MGIGQASEEVGGRKWDEPDNWRPVLDEWDSVDYLRFSASSSASQRQLICASFHLCLLAPNVHFHPPQLPRQGSPQACVHPQRRKTPMIN